MPMELIDIDGKPVLTLRPGMRAWSCAGMASYWKEPDVHPTAPR